MPERRVHNRICKENNLDKEVADEVNYFKDRPSQKYISLHRGFNHGLLTNLKYLSWGVEGIAVARLHDRVDRIEGFKKRGGSRGALF